MDKIWFYGTFPGMLGGLAAFCYALRKGRVSRKNFAGRLFSDLCGGATLSSGFFMLLTPLLKDQAMFIASLSIGTAWIGVFESLRAFVKFEVTRALREFRRKD